MEDEENLAHFVEVYRPKKFSQVLGQPAAINILSDYAKRRMTNGILLCGPKGSGKTTLARIYGRSFLCESADEDGSPCGECDRCKDGLGYEEVTDFSQERLREIGRTTGGTVLSQYRCFFFDEAQLLAGQAFDHLLTTLENPDSLTVFVFATTSLSKIPGTIRSRVKLVGTRQLSDSELSALATFIAEDADIDLREDIRARLVSSAAGDTRLVVRHMWDVKTFGIIDADIARNHFGESDESLAMDLLNEAITGSKASRLLTIARCSKADVRSFQERIHGLLHHIHTSIFMKMSDEAAEYGMVDYERKLAFADAVRKLAEVSSKPVDRLWESLVYYWDLGRDVGKATFENRVMRFRSLLEDLHSPPRDSQSDDKIRLRRRQMYVHRSKPSLVHLTYEQVRALWNAASYLIQEYGVTFNGSVDVAWSAFGVLKDVDVAILTGKLRHDLDSSVARWKLADQRFAYAYVREHTVQAGHRMTMTFHADAMLFNRIRDYLRIWFERNTGHREPTEDVGFFVCDYSRDQRSRFKVHQRLLRHLIGGVDPEIMVGDAQNGLSPLVDVLRIPPEERRSIGTLGSMQRFRVSATIGPTVWKTAVAEKMSPLSAFDDGAWTQLAEEWEFWEYKDRLLEKAAREHAPAAEVTNGLDRPRGPGLDSKLRTRSWRGWWIE